MCRALAAILAGCLMLCGSTGRAVEPLDPSVAPFWQAARNPDLRRAQTLLRQGRSQLYPALGSAVLFGSIGHQRRIALENALARFRRAHKLAPRDPEILFLQAQALSLWEAELPNGLVQRRDAEAIERYLELRELSPRYQEHQVAFDLGVLYTRAGEFDRAREEYRRAIETHLGEGSVATEIANLAEVTMMAGDLAEAARLYERAMQLGAGEQRLLPMWGLSVALDRLGERSAALQTAQRASEEDRRPMAVLGMPSVFFVPAYELHYYTGLGHLALAVQQLGHDVHDCERALAANASLRGATRQVLLEVIQKSDQLLATRPKHRAYAELRERAHTQLKRRNASVRRGEPASKKSSADATALLHALSALGEYQRYLSYGGEQGPWASDAREHVDALQRCLGLEEGRR